MTRTTGSAAAANGTDAAGADDCPELGRLSIYWYPVRVVGEVPHPSQSAPAPVLKLTEQEAVKNRSLVADAGAEAHTKVTRTHKGKFKPALLKQVVTIYYRELRVLVARGVLLPSREVAPAYRGGGGAAGGSAGGSGIGADGGGNSDGAGRATAAATTADDAAATARVKAETGSRPPGGGKAGAAAGGSRKRKATEVEIVVLV